MLYSVLVGSDLIFCSLLFHVSVSSFLLVCCLFSSSFLVFSSVIVHYVFVRSRLFSSLLFSFVLVYSLLTALFWSLLFSSVLFSSSALYYSVHVISVWSCPVFLLPCPILSAKSFLIPYLILYKESIQNVFLVC